MDMLTSAAVPPVVWPGMVLLGLLSVLFAVFLIRSPALNDQASRQAGSALLPAVFIRYWYWLTSPLIGVLAAIGVAPNHVTGLSVVLAVATAACIGTGHFMAATWLLAASMTCDLLDGLLARQHNRQSSAGAFFDSFCDRLSDGVLMGGIAYWGRDGWLLLVGVAALIFSVLVSYARARGEALGVDCKIGLMQRPERLLVTVFTLFLASMLPALLSGGAPLQVRIVTIGIGSMAALAALTAVRRGRYIMAELSDAGPSPTSSN